MSLQQFEVVLNHIAGNHRFRKRNQEYGGRNQINLEKALLITLWVLATPDSYRSVGDRLTTADQLNTLINAMLGMTSALQQQQASQQESRSS